MHSHTHTYTHTHTHTPDTHSSSPQLGKEMVDALSEMRAAIARNATSLDSRILSAAQMVSSERAGSEQELRKFEKDMQKQALRQAGAASKLRGAIRAAQASLKQQAKDLDARFSSLTDVTEEARSSSRSTLQQLTAELVKLGVIVQRGELLQARYRELSTQLDAARNATAEGWPQQEQLARKVSSELAATQDQVQQTFGNFTTDVENQRLQRTQDTAATQELVQTLQARINVMYNALQTLRLMQGPKGAPGPPGVYYVCVCVCLWVRVCVCMYCCDTRRARIHTHVCKQTDRHLY
jgi:DNA repair exonuclease SbcCD ATPase subunit